MEQDHIARIRRTWALAAADPAATSRVFYSTLFRMDPTTKPLFQGDLEVQGKKLTDTLGFIVDHLDALDILVPAAQELATRHVSYGVAKDQYDSVGAALIATFQKLLGVDFSSEDTAAWSAVYGTLADAMTSHAYAE